MELVLEVLFIPIAFVLFLLVLYIRLSQLFPGPAQRLAGIAAWVTTNIFPSFWRCLDRPIGFVRARIFNWYTADPALQRGEVEQSEGPISLD